MSRIIPQLSAFWTKKTTKQWSFIYPSDETAKSPGLRYRSKLRSQPLTRELTSTTTSIAAGANYTISLVYTKSSPLHDSVSEKARHPSHVAAIVLSKHSPFNRNMGLIHWWSARTRSN